MAEAIFFESRGENILGQIAVGLTIKNRAFKSRGYPDNICDVVRQGKYWQGNPVKHKCQYSYWCDGLPETIRNKEAWRTALDLAKIIINTDIEIEGLEGITHYHALHVKPPWSKKLIHIATIGRHKFYVTSRQSL